MKNLLRKIVSASKMPENVGKIISRTDAISTLDKKYYFNADGSAKEVFIKLQEKLLIGDINKKKGGYERVSKDTIIKTEITDNAISETIVRIADSEFSLQLSNRLKNCIIQNIEQYQEFNKDWTMQSRKLGENCLDNVAGALLLKFYLEERKEDPFMKLSAFNGFIADNMMEVLDEIIYAPVDAIVTEGEDGYATYRKAEFSFEASSEKWAPVADFLNGKIDTLPGNIIVDDLGKTKQEMITVLYSYINEFIIPQIIKFRREDELFIGSDIEAPFNELLEEISDGTGVHQKDIYCLFKNSFYRVKTLITSAYNKNLGEDMKDIITKAVANEMYIVLDEISKKTGFDLERNLRIEEVISFAYHSSVSPVYLRGSKGIPNWKAIELFMLGNKVDQLGNNINPFDPKMGDRKMPSMKASDLTIRRMFKVFGNAIGKALNKDVEVPVSSEIEASNIRIAVLDAIRVPDGDKDVPVIFHEGIKYAANLKKEDEFLFNEKLRRFIKKTNDLAEKAIKSGEDFGLSGEYVFTKGIKKGADKLGVVNADCFDLFRIVDGSERKIGTTGNLFIKGSIILNLDNILLIEEDK